MTRATIVFAALAVVLAVLAGSLDTATWAEKTLWFAALASGTAGCIAAYGVAISWARKRKRLWG